MCQIASSAPSFQINTAENSVAAPPSRLLIAARKAVYSTATVFGAYGFYENLERMAPHTGKSILINGFMEGLKNRMIKGGLPRNSIAKDWKLMEEPDENLTSAKTALKNIALPYALPVFESWANLGVLKDLSLPGYGGSIIRAGIIGAGLSSSYQFLNPSVEIKKDEPQLTSTTVGLFKKIADNPAQVIFATEFLGHIVSDLESKYLARKEKSLVVFQDKALEPQEKGYFLGFLSQAFAVSALSSIGENAYFLADRIVEPFLSGIEKNDKDKQSLGDWEKHLAEAAFVGSKLGGIASLTVLQGPVLVPLLGAATLMVSFPEVLKAATSLKIELDAKKNLSQEDKKIEVSNVLKTINSYGVPVSENECFIKKDWNLIHDKDSSSLGAAGYFSVDGLKNYYFPIQTAVDVVDAGYKLTKNTLCDRVSNPRFNGALQLTLAVGMMTFGVAAINWGAESPLGNYSIAEMTGMI